MGKETDGNIEREERVNMEIENKHDKRKKREGQRVDIKSERERYVWEKRKDREGGMVERKNEEKMKERC